MRGAERFAAETHLSRRVDDWQAKLEPALLAAESRPAFDLETYGNTVISHLEEDPQADGRSGLCFAKIASGVDNFEACRLFLAALQLANGAFPDQALSRLCQVNLITRIPSPYRRSKCRYPRRGF